MSNLIHFKADPIQFVEECWRERGDLVQLRLGPLAFTLLSNADYARVVLQTQREAFPKSRLIHDKIEVLTGRRGLVQLDGEPWKQFRRITNLAFHRTALERYVPIIDRVVFETYAMLDHAAETGAVVDLSALATSLVLRTAGLLLMSLDLADVASEAGERFLEAHEVCGRRIRQVLDLPLFFPSPDNLRLKRAVRNLRKSFAEAIEQRQQRGATGEDMLGALLSSSELSELGDDAELLIDQVMTFLFAGHETTASSLVWSFYLALEHPESADKVAAEARRELSEAPASREDIRKLEGCLRLYQESLRLYPPAWVLARELASDVKLENATLKRGTQVLLNVRGIHRHPAYWSHPESFRPQRFADGAEPNDPFAFIPFGAGPRICSGTQLALIEGTLILARILSRYRLLRPDGFCPPAMDSLITLRPKGDLIVRLERR